MSSVILEQEANLRPLMEKFEQRLYEVAVTHSSTTGQLASHVIEAGGKRLRPQLVILSGWKLDNDWETLLDVAVAAELLHTASLIHDDIIDCADTRRGILSLNALWGNQAAVMAGDYLFARALALLSQESAKDALPFMVKSIETMCEGIIEEITTLFDTAVTEEDYLSRIDKKTASLVATCCGTGALVSGASQEEVAAYTDFGRNLGMCFQIVDDILDFTSDEETLGKPAGSDFSQGILTLPAIYLLQHPDWNQPIREILAKHRCTNNDLACIKEAADKTESIQRSCRKARQFQENARECLRFIPITPAWPILNRLTETVMIRKK